MSAGPAAGRRERSAEIGESLADLQPEIRVEVAALVLAALAGDEDEAHTGRNQA